MDHYLAERSRLFNESSEFYCLDSCERYGCQDPELHITVSLVDLLAVSRVCGKQISSLFEENCKVGFDPLEEDEPWIGRLTIELRKPCSFLHDKWCMIYFGRPVACALFPEAFFVLGKREELLKREVFQKFPCLANPVEIPSNRRVVLQRLLEMSAEEMFLSDFYLFGVSPFLVDLKNAAGKILEGVEVKGKEKAVIPHHRFETFVMEHLQRSDLLDYWIDKIRFLDRDEGVKEFWAMKTWTDEMLTMEGKNSSILVHQFVGNRLEGTRFHR